MAVSNGVPQLPETSPTVEKVLMSATRFDRSLLPHCDLPFGSSVVVAARKPVEPGRERRTS